MKIAEKILLDRKGLEAHGPINVVILGDSVSHGAVNGYIDYENVYWNRLKKKLNAYRDYIPVNMINCSVGGITAKGSVAKLPTQVFNHNPDLVIVCFGLNDVNGSLESYLGALAEIFDRSLASGADVIFMTPNMLNTSVAEDTEQRWWDYAHKTAEMQNGGRMDLYMESAVKLAKEKGVTVCDCYAVWKERSKTEDVTKLLINRINHPVPEMHELFADMLFETIFEGTDQKPVSTLESTMYKGV